MAKGGRGPVSWHKQAVWLSLPRLKMTSSEVQFMAMTEPEDDCPICMEPLAWQCNTVTPCCHVFHKECLNRWLRQPPKHQQPGPNKCPTCRGEIAVPKVDNAEESEQDDSEESQEESEEDGEQDDPDYDPMTDSSEDSDSY